MRRMTGGEVVLVCENSLGDFDVDTEGQEGMAMLAPYGDRHTTARPQDPAKFRALYPNLKFNAEGEVEVIQRLTKENAAAMVNEFRSVGGRFRRFFKGAPIFRGHPDEPGIAHRYPDKSEKGQIARLEARDDAFYGQPIFNEAGTALLAGEEKLGFSARWLGVPTGEQNGKLIYEPFKFVSAGMTSRPRLPVSLLNEAPQTLTTENTENTEGKEGKDDMNKLILIPLLAGLGLSLTNEATDADIEKALKDLAADRTAALAKEALEAARLSAVNEKARADAASTEFANERKARIDEKLAIGIRLMTITEAERADWQRRLTANFTNEAPAFDALKPKLKTHQITADMSTRTGPGDKSAGARAEVMSLANSLFEGRADKETNSETAWTWAYSEALRQRPAAAEAMKTGA